MLALLENNRQQGERTDLVTSGLEVPKLELGERQQKRIRAHAKAPQLWGGAFVWI